MFTNLKLSGFKVSNFRCKYCAKLLIKLLLELPGINLVYSSFSKKLLFVVYDSTIGDINLLRETVKEIGFSTRWLFNFSYN